MISDKVSRSSPVASGNGMIHTVFEVKLADGAEARHLALEQARIFQEITVWLAARKLYDSGQNHTG